MMTMTMTATFAMMTVMKRAITILDITMGHVNLSMTEWKGGMDGDCSCSEVALTICSCANMQAVGLAAQAGACWSCLLQ